MSKTNLKENIWIEGFEDESRGYVLRDFRIMQGVKIVYFGKTSEIPEELAKQYVESLGIWDELSVCFRDYSGTLEKNVEEYCMTAKESIQSACQSEFCIIYKTNKHE